MSHKHGAHQCYCPSCGHTETVDAYVKCNTIYCPECGDRMRAVETGEFRGTGRVSNEIEPPLECPSPWPFILLGLAGGVIVGAAMKGRA